MIRIFCILLFLVVAESQAQQKPQKRPMALQEAIQQALEHNLGLQILRYDPQIALLDLRGAYGYYDPSLNFTARQSFSSRPGGFNTAIGAEFPANETYVESFSSTVGGVLPVTGLQYDLGGSVNRSSGSTFGRDRGFQYNSGADISLRQPLLRNAWIDAGRYQILFGKKTVKISELALAQQIMDVITRVEEGYYELIFARENVKVQEKALELAERSASENKKRVEVGAMAPLDEKQAESLVASSKAGLLLAKRTLSVSQNFLKSLLTGDYASLHDQEIEPSDPLVPTVIPFNLPESWQRALTLRPEIQQLRVELERRDITLKYQKNQIFPSLDLIGSYGHSGLDANFGPSLQDLREGSNPAWSYGAQLTIPLGNRTARNRYRATKAEKEQAILRLKQLEQNIMVEVDNAVTLAQTNFERIEATRQARLYAEAALDAEQKKLENGKSTSFQVLQLQRDLTRARSEEIRALTDYNASLSRLSLSEGATLDRTGFNLGRP